MEVVSKLFRARIYNCMVFISKYLLSLRNNVSQTLYAHEVMSVRKIPHLQSVIILYLITCVPVIRKELWLNNLGEYRRSGINFVPVKKQSKKKLAVTYLDPGVHGVLGA